MILFTCSLFTVFGQVSEAEKAKQKLNQYLKSKSLDKLKEAKTIIDRAVDNAPGSALLWYTKGLIYTEWIQTDQATDKHFKETVQSFKEALELDTKLNYRNKLVDGVNIFKRIASDSGAKGWSGADYKAAYDYYIHAVRAN